MRWIAVNSWWEIGWSFFFNFPDLVKGFNFKTSISLSSLTVKGVMRSFPKVSGCSLSVKRLLVSPSNLSIRLHVNALIHSEDDCFSSPICWGFFWQACGFRRSGFSVMVNNTSKTVVSETWGPKLLLTNLLKSLKDISGKGISDDTANAIGRAEMKINRYINSGICVNNSNRVIQ